MAWAALLYLCQSSADSAHTYARPMFSEGWMEGMWYDQRWINYLGENPMNARDYIGTLRAELKNFRSMSRSRGGPGRKKELTGPSGMLTLWT